MGQARRKAIALGLEPNERWRLIAVNRQQQYELLLACRRATRETIDGALMALLDARAAGYRLSIGRGPRP